LTPSRPTLAPGTPLYRVYDATWGYDEHNPGKGDTRFAPVDDPGTEKRLPNMYLGETPTAALLETVFHDVHDVGGKVIYQQYLREKQAELASQPPAEVIVLFGERYPVKRVV